MAYNTVDNKRLIVPNSALLNGTITNFTTNADIGAQQVDVSDDLVLQARKVMKDAKVPPNVEIFLFLSTKDMQALLGTDKYSTADKVGDGGTQLRGPSQRVALPERQPRGHAGSGRHEDAVVGDVLDAPRGGAEREHVAAVIEGHRCRLLGGGGW